MNLPLTRTFAGRTVIQSPPFPEFVIRAEDLHAGADDPSVRVIDLRPAAHGGEGYIPGSVHLDYARLVRGRGTLEGLMPEPGEFA